MNPYETGLERNPANYAPLTPLSFLERTAAIWPGAARGGPRRASPHLGGGCPARRRLASRRCRARGVGVGDTVAAMLPNVPEMVEMHFGVPMTGAVLNTLNTRLDAEAIAFMLEHGEAKVLITDREFARHDPRALARLGAAAAGDRRRATRSAPASDRLGERLRGLPRRRRPRRTRGVLPTTSGSAIALNYTSGTTGNPKGVV